MRSKYDGAVTTLFRNHEKLSRLATDGALEGTHQAQVTPFLGNPGVFRFFNDIWHFLPDCKLLTMGDGSLNS